MKILKESKKSMRFILIAIGLIGLSYAALGWYSSPAAMELVSSLVSVTLSLITLFIGIKFYILIQTISELLIKFFWFQLILAVAVDVYIYSSGQFNGFLLSVFRIFILVVIINNIKRLAQEEKAVAVGAL